MNTLEVRRDDQVDITGQRVRVQCLRLKAGHICSACGEPQSIGMDAVGGVEQGGDAGDLVTEPRDQVEHGRAERFLP
jgi:hypothetical protein